MLVGFHVEGWDHLVFHALLAALLGVPPDEIEADWIDATGRGWDFVLRNVGLAIQRFYYRGAALAVVGIDNDGNVDLIHQGTQEDPKRPRHWNHGAPRPDCRTCQVEAVVADERARLSAVHDRAPGTWPIVIGVPVEAVEAWLLELTAIVDPSRGLVRAEDRLRSRYKDQLYGRPGAARADVERVALPLIAAATPAQLAELRHRGRSFDSFARQVEGVKAQVRGEPLPPEVTG